MNEIIGPEQMAGCIITLLFDFLSKPSKNGRREAHVRSCMVKYDFATALVNNLLGAYIYVLYTTIAHTNYRENMV